MHHLGVDDVVMIAAHLVYALYSFQVIVRVIVVHVNIMVVPTDITQQLIIIVWEGINQKEQQIPLVV